MPLSLPKLDDRTFADLSAELRGLIPQYSKSWTDHNPSDPGIILLELFSWHAEQVLYRLNQINERSYLNFVELIGVEPSGPKAEITFEIDVAAKEDLLEDFIIPLGTIVTARDELTDQEIIFETLESLSKNDGWWDSTAGCWNFKTMAVNTVEIKDEVLGKSNGLPKQEFAFSHKPVFLNKNDEGYIGNPTITIAGEIWEYRNDLFESHGDGKQFTVEQVTGLVRFGEEEVDEISSIEMGMIPTQGEEIICTYRIMGGPQGNVSAGAINEHKSGIDPAYTVRVFNEYPATGGVESENLEDLLRRSLERIQERYRAVSEDDFERLTKDAVPGKIARVKVVFDKNLESATSEKEGHVSLIILPKAKALGLPDKPTTTERDPVTGKLHLTHTCADITSKLSSYHTEKVKQDILRFFDKRRLITVVLHVVTPTFTSVNLDITISPKTGVNEVPLREKTRKRIASFLDPYEGWEDGKGWPFGRDVYRSELCQQLEGMDGVDHVVAMSMNGDANKNSLSVGENDLVCLNMLNVTVASS